MRYFAHVIFVAMIAPVVVYAHAYEGDDHRRSESLLTIEGVILDAGYDKEKDHNVAIMVVKKVLQGPARKEFTVTFYCSKMFKIYSGDRVKVTFKDDAEPLNAMSIDVFGNIFIDLNMPIPESKLPRF